MGCCSRLTCELVGWRFCELVKAEFSGLLLDWNKNRELRREDWILQGDGGGAVVRSLTVEVIVG